MPGGSPSNGGSPLAPDIDLSKKATEPGLWPNSVVPRSHANPAASVATVSFASTRILPAGCGSEKLFFHCSRAPTLIHSRTVPSLPQSRLQRALTPVFLLPFLLTSCSRNRFPTYPANYREFAYVSNGAAGTVTVLDLVYLRQDRVLQVGRQPIGLAVNPVRNEVYAVNSGSDSVSVIDVETNTVTATIGVHHTPYIIAIAPDGKRGYVPNSGSNTVSVLDLDKRREIAIEATGEGPGLASVSPDNRTLVVSNRVAGSVSVYSIDATGKRPLQLREAFSGCAGATDIVLQPNDSTDLKSGAKAFIACSGSAQVMTLWLGATPDSWSGSQDASLQHDHLLCLLDVGKTPTHLALASPAAARVFSTNFDSDSISEINTWTNEVVGTKVVGTKPSSAILSQDDSALWVTNFGADSASLYSPDDGRVMTSVRTGPKPDAIAFSHDEHLLLVADSGSADVSVIRTQSKDGPSLVTLLPSGGQPNDIVVKSFRAK
jgi:YVTN family beta-propeller protein